MRCLLAIVVYMIPATAIRCFDCVSQLPETTPKDAQLALRTILETTYNLPPVDPYCNNSADVFFRGIRKIVCSKGQECVKITAKNKDLSFVIRSCRGTVYRQGFYMSGVDCSSQHSPSVCVCDNNLCNSANRLPKLFIWCFLTIFIMILYC